MIDAMKKKRIILRGREKSELARRCREWEGKGYECVAPIQSSTDQNSYDRRYMVVMELKVAV